MRHTTNTKQAKNKESLMSSSALAVMIVAMVAIWGGLAWSVMHLITNPDIDMDKVPDDH